MQEQMGNISREIEALRKNQEEMGDIKNTVTERMPLMGLSVDYTQP